MKTILISGGTGTIGQHITAKLLSFGFQVRFLSTRRNYRKEGVETFHWDPSKYSMDRRSLEGTDAIIHLAGASISKRWTQNYKEEIYNSRIQSTDTLYRALKEGNPGVKHFISTSAVGYYPSHPTKIYHEDDSPGTDFLSAVCHHWEEHARLIGDLGIREARLRVGFVLDKDSGALQKMALPVKFGLGAPIGSGQQYIPWIHLEDVANMFIHLLTHPELTGPFNGVGPESVKNRDLMKSIAKVLHRPMFLPPVPGFLLKLVMGQMATLALMSTRVSNEKIAGSGFSYQFSTLEEALKDLYQ
ncbi:MAG: TIGR01777 family oxidoreductase [Bacteroidota bacterium]|nr:TIGR01777 family oxidoreductase [Bacteroidota bacterium]MDX5428721.1 TIGR01777 family oxidoreductase [Bacteroidota bacterium]MDX5448852.1 TIGR01777 family oxidoreductase [Bacteroidota bacterium]MDX5506449.1 TIGR01777 family oxidoreductase [Bacteroidota bacterium]